MKLFKNWFKQKKKLKYPDDFAIINFTDVAIENGITDDANKVIDRYYYDSMGNLIVKRKRYSKELAFALRKVLKVPIYDKTEKELTFPVVGNIELGIVKFQSK